RTVPVRVPGLGSGRERQRRRVHNLNNPPQGLCSGEVASSVLPDRSRAGRALPFSTTDVGAGRVVAVGRTVRLLAVLRGTIGGCDRRGNPLGTALVARAEAPVPGASLDCQRG